MKLRMRSMVAAAVATAFVTSMGVAQDLQEVTVQGTRVLNTKVETTSAGTPILDVSISYGVGYADLNLASQYGPIALEKRVRDAAKAACEEISRQYPQTTTSNADCARAATDKALIKVRELVAAARLKLPQ
jgi:UrcA family protein